MISFNEALKIVLESANLLGPEQIPLCDALGRTLAEDIFSDVDVPPADMSAMDGFACLFGERNQPLRIIETIAAGSTPRHIITNGTCSRIMTGAIVPDGADCVVMFEHTEENENSVNVKKLTDKRNIRYKAEDIRTGECVLKKGMSISTAACAVLGTVGKTQVPVVNKPRTTVIATGNELVEPDVIPDPAHIRNSNSTQVYAQILRCGAIPFYSGIARDTLSNTASLLEGALASSDVIILTGGVSAGDFDCVPQVLRDCGFKIFFERIAIKPGKATVFAKKGDKTVFGLPGNPVSTFVLFELLVRPYLMKMMGHTYQPIIIKVILENDVKRKKGDRIEIVPVRFTPNGGVESVQYHGSAHIHAYTEAQGFLYLDNNIEFIRAGSAVNVQILEK